MVIDCVAMCNVFSTWDLLANSQDDCDDDVSWKEFNRPLYMYTHTCNMSQSGRQKSYNVAVTTDTKNWEWWRIFSGNTDFNTTFIAPIIIIIIILW